MNITDIDPLTAILSIPAVLALVNLVKGAVELGKFAALVAVGIGIVLSVSVYQFGDQGWFVAATQGLLIGLAASGLWDVANEQQKKTEQIEVTGQ